MDTLTESHAKLSTRKPHPRRGHLIPKISLITRTQARNLYVLHQVGAAEVAQQTGLTIKQVYSLAEREGWTVQRKEIKGKSLEAQNARLSAQAEEIVEAAALESAELTLSTFAKAKEAIAKGGPMAAKDVQAWSQATKNYVGIFRQAKQLDVAQQGEAGSTTNVFFLSNLTPAPRILKSVTCSESLDTAAHAPVNAQATQDSVSTQNVQVSPPAVGGTTGA